MTLFVVLLFILNWMHETDYHVHAMFHERLKNAANRAAHDASLQMDREELKEGRYVFDESEALRRFRHTLAENLGLTNELKPKPGTLLKDPVHVVYEDYIDESDSVTFPYRYENPKYRMEETVRGPAVIYVIEVDYPRYFQLTEAKRLFKPVVFEYPFYE